MSLVNKVAIVTGASSGIGAAIALKFVAEGAKVTIVGRNEAKLKNVYDKCAKLGTAPLLILADVSKDENNKRIVNETLNKFGKLDVLVNNAGCGLTTRILAPDAIQVYDEVMGSNFRSIVTLSHYAAPHIVKTKGNIINISSNASLRPYPLAGFAYNSSKAAMDHFTRTLAVELGEHGVRVNVINPGPVRTDILKNAGSNEAEEKQIFEMMKKGTLLGKISESEEIAELVSFVASEKAGSITGAAYVIDNGSMWK